MSRKHRSITVPQDAQRCSSIGGRQDRRNGVHAILEAALHSVGLRSEERILIVGTGVEALEIMCSLLRQGVPQVTIVRDRWAVKPHSITLIVVSSLAPGTQLVQAIDMAPRALAASGRLVFASPASGLSGAIESTLRRSGFDLKREETALGSLLYAVPSMAAASQRCGRSGRTIGDRSTSTWHAIA